MIELDECSQDSLTPLFLSNRIFELCMCTRNVNKQDTKSLQVTMQLIWKILVRIQAMFGELLNKILQTVYCLKQGVVLSYASGNC